MVRAAKANLTGGVLDCVRLKRANALTVEAGGRHPGEQPTLQRAPKTGGAGRVLPCLESRRPAGARQAEGRIVRGLDRAVRPNQGGCRFSCGKYGALLAARQ